MTCAAVLVSSALTAEPFVDGVFKWKVSEPLIDVGLDGEWRALAATLSKPFAARETIEPKLPWANSISRGELLRSGVDEFLEVDPQHLRFLFQGVDAEGYQGKYGGIP